MTELPREKLNGNTTLGTQCGMLYWLFPVSFPLKQLKSTELRRPTWGQKMWFSLWHRKKPWDLNLWMWHPWLQLPWDTVAILNHVSRYSILYSLWQTAYVKWEADLVSLLNQQKWNLISSLYLKTRYYISTRVLHQGTNS